MGIPTGTPEQREQLLAGVARTMLGEPQQLVVDACETAAAELGLQPNPWIYDVGMQYIRETMVDEGRDARFHEPERGKRKRGAP